LYEWLREGMNGALSSENEKLKHTYCRRADFYLFKRCINGFIYLVNPKWKIMVYAVEKNISKPFPSPLERG